MAKGRKKGAAPPEAKGYRHPTADLASRPEVGAAPRFQQRKPPAKYRYDDSLSPSLEWDENPARETGAFLLACIQDAAALAPPHVFAEPRELKGADGTALMRVAGLQDAVERLKRLEQPFLNWSGKAEGQSFEVPTLPLFVHERLSTQAIVETLRSHRKKPAQENFFELFADPQRSLSDQVRAFEHRDKWVNRLILGDSLAVMNSLLRYEGVGGQVQTIYIDPPYGVRFGSNFQPFVRKRDVGGDDADLTREPEMVRAYRDTWELGLHSYLTHLRDRLIAAKDLLSSTGSVFVQIGPENLNYLLNLLDEIFGRENRCSVIAFRKTTGSTGELLSDTNDYMCWYAKDLSRVKFRHLFLRKAAGEAGGLAYNRVELPDGTRRRMTKEERDRPDFLPRGSKIYTLDNLQSQSIGREKGEGAASWFPVELDGKTYRPSMQARWKTSESGMARLAQSGRLEATEGSLRYVRFLQDFPCVALSNFWDDTSIAGFASDKLYIVQTNAKVVERCVLMTTDPGDLVLDPTCGSGTTAYVAEQWGRRWITIDTSRVPLALARQRLLTATFPWFRLKDERAGPGGGFEYLRRQNKKGEEVGGIVPHVTLRSISSNEPSDEEVLVDRPEEDRTIVRVTGPFVVEATLPTPLDLHGDGKDDDSGTSTSHADHVARMTEVLRRASTLELPGKKHVTLRNIRPPAKSQSLSAEAVVDGDPSGGLLSLSTAIEAAHEQSTGGLPLSSASVAILFGPENGAVTARAVLSAAKEANAKNYRHLFVIGFAITPEARADIDGGEAVLGLPATFVSATMDLQMGDLLKTLRSSQVFSVCGQPEVQIVRLGDDKDSGMPRWQVKLLGLDVFDPVTMETDHRDGDDVPCWMLDSDWNGMVFHATQVFFPRTSAWESLKKALKATHEESVWAHLAGSTSAPFEAMAGGDIAVKVIDDRGNELLVVKRLEGSPPA